MRNDSAYKDATARNDSRRQVNLTDPPAARPWLHVSGLVPHIGEDDQAAQQDAPPLALRVVDVIDLEAGRAAFSGAVNPCVEEASEPGPHDQRMIPDSVVQRQDVRRLARFSQKGDAPDAVVVEQPPALRLREDIEAGVAGRVLETRRHVGAEPSKVESGRSRA